MKTIKFKNRKIFNVALDLLSKNSELIYDIGFSDMLITFPTEEMYDSGLMELNVSSAISSSQYEEV